MINFVARSASGEVVECEHRILRARFVRRPRFTRDDARLFEFLARISFDECFSFFVFAFLILFLAGFYEFASSFSERNCSPLPPRPTKRNATADREHSPSSDKRRQFWFQFLWESSHVGHFDVLVRLRFDLTKRAPLIFDFDSEHEAAEIFASLELLIDERRNPRAARL